ncbi:alpha-glucosidase family protein [Pararhodobacter marinus]|uniref:alpha-glucosidase family protein n=1 Tax=Pararhodobacter marinus TaxID=2184063 RepID=UPI00351486CA
MNLMQDFRPGAELPDDKDWWRGAVIYQIYPRSFQDSNGDGIGDLAGIIHRLEHIKQLGVDAIWISPFFRSPMLDFGYDISNYCDVEPIFGSLGDFDALISRAHDLGIRVLIDLVLSHTSNQHPWFQESQNSRDNHKSDWYVWADPKPDGTPPNNWLSIFGGSAWEWSGDRMQYFLHNFLKEQPDLNLHNPEVQDALLGIVRFWLERGVDGFRLDTVNFYFHDSQLRDNPALDPARRNATIAPEVNPYNWQDHLYSKNQPENLAFLKRLRSLMDEYGATTLVGEIGDGQYGMQLQAAYTEGDDKVHMCYAFDLLSGNEPSAEFFGQVLRTHEREIGDGWACWAFSNHDVTRHASRWALGEEQRALFASILLSLQGSVCLYQGEELGLTEAYVAFEDLQDPYGIRFWPKFKGRDGCRTPMPWTSDYPHGGFSSHEKPWLPMAAEHLSKAVAVQENDDESLLAFYRRMVAFRHARPALERGSLTVVRDSDGVLAFLRVQGDERLLCAFNMSAEPRDFTLPEGDWVADPEAPYKADLSQPIAPFSAVFAQQSV